MATGVQVTIDCADPARLAGFWAAVLGYELEPPPPGYDSWDAFLRANNIPEESWNDYSAVRDPAQRGPRLFFQRVPEPKITKNRVHLDVNTAAGLPRDQRPAHLAAEAARLVGLGASEVRTVDEPMGYHIVMQDPEGNEFCLQ